MSFLRGSITRTSQMKRSRRSCPRAPGTDSSTCLPAPLKTSGRSASRRRRRASTEVTASLRRLARGHVTQPLPQTLRVLCPLQATSRRTWTLRHDRAEGSRSTRCSPREKRRPRRRIKGQTRVSSRKTDSWLLNVAKRTTVCLNSFTLARSLRVLGGCANCVCVKCRLMIVINKNKLC